MFQHAGFKHKYFLTFWAFLENCLFSGLRAGWASLVYILKQEGVYGDLCTQVIASDDNLLGYNSRNTLLGNQTGLAITALVGRLENFTNDAFNEILATTTISGKAGDFVEYPELEEVFLCEKQDEKFNQCFSVATAWMALCGLLFGQLNFKFGIHVPRVLSMVSFVTGAVCFAFINKDSPWLIFPGLLFLSSGGMGLYLTNNQISYMYSTGSAAVVGLLCGGLEASSFMLTIIKLLYEQGFNLQSCFLVLGALDLLTLVSTYSLLPKHFITNSEQCETSETASRQIDHQAECHLKQHVSQATYNHTSDSLGERYSDGQVKQRENEGDNSECYTICKPEDCVPCYVELQDFKSGELKNHDLSKVQIYCEKSAQKENDHLDKAGSSITDRDEDNVSVPGTDQHSMRTLVKCLFSRTYILYLCWSAIVNVVLAMALGNFNAWLEYVTGNDKTAVSLYTDVLYYTMLSSPVLAVLAGVAVDLLKRAPADDKSATNRNVLLASTASLGMTSLLGLVVCSFFIHISHPQTITAACIAVVLYRTGLYSCGTAFIRIMYPTHLFGILCGIMSVLAGTISFVQYPLFLWIQAEGNAWLQVFGFLAMLLSMTLASPLCLFYKSRRYRSKNEQR